MTNLVGVNRFSISEDGKLLVLANKHSIALVELTTSWDSLFKDHRDNTNLESSISKSVFEI